MRYDTDLGVHILDEAEAAALIDRALAKQLGPECRQANGAPPSHIPDSVDIILDDFSTAFEQAMREAETCGERSNV